MSAASPSLVRSVFRNTVAGLADLFLFKLGTTLVFILLVRLLEQEQIGILGIASGYLLLLGFLDVRPIQVLLRDYPRIARDPAERDVHLTAFLVFWAVQSVVILAVSLALQILVLDRLGIEGLSFVYLGLTVDFLGVTLQDLVKTVLYTDLQQGAATRVGLALGLARLASMTTLFLFPSLATYSWVLIGTSIVSGAVWLLVLSRRLRFRFHLSRRIPALLRESLSEYGLWNHGQAVVMSTLVLVDTLVLSLAGESLRAIGNYTIALRFTSVFFFQASWQISRSLQVVLARQEEEHRRVRAINSFLKLNAALSLTLLLAVFVAGSWMIRLLFGADVDPDAVRFALITGAGATIMNLGWPLMAVISNSCSLRKALFSVYLPVWALGVLVYFAAGFGWGAPGVAWANIVVYSIVVTGLVLFLRRNYPFPLDLRPITLEERTAIRELIRARS
jgi:O-antigen/teichoic acid export membrane protein